MNNATIGLIFLSVFFFVMAFFTKSDIPRFNNFPHFLLLGIGAIIIAIINLFL